MKKSIELIQHRVIESGRTPSHETELTFSDGSLKYILITDGMIFVSDWPEDELNRRILENDDSAELYTAYDTTDGVAYYLSSEYAAEISSAMINFTHWLIAACQ